MIVVGVGPGLGAAVARRFGRAGYDVALLARTEASLASLGEALKSEGITAGWSAVDITDDAALRAAITRFGEYTGHLEAVHFNPSAFTEKGPLELSPAELLRDVHLGVASLLTVVQAARPFMADGGRITAAGSMTADRPWAGAASLGVQKAGLRNLVAAIDATLKGDGIRAASLTVRGTLAAGTAFDPSRVADAVFALSQRPADAWTTEASYDGS
jgi:NADP-dependent 3-hydroxy acid dehydrogenase YdfG